MPKTKNGGWRLDDHNPAPDYEKLSQSKHVKNPKEQEQHTGHTSPKHSDNLNEKTLSIDLRTKQALNEAEELLDEITEEISLTDDPKKIKELNRAQARLKHEIDRHRYPDNAM